MLTTDLFFQASSYTGIWTLLGVPAGYWGQIRAFKLSCRFPYYRKECQLTCTWKEGETCHPSFGCVLPATTKTRTITRIETTAKIQPPTEGIIPIICR